MSDAAIEEFAAAIKRSPQGTALEPGLLSGGLNNLDSRGLAALLKDLAKDRHSRRAREVSRRRKWHAFLGVLVLKGVRGLSREVAAGCSPAANRGSAAAFVACECD
jgi:hypothetical protein